MPFVLAISLLAAIQPVVSSSSAVPSGAFQERHFGGRGNAGGDFNRPFPAGARRGPARERQFAPVVRPSSGFTIDGGRLLAELALTGAFTGLFWLAMDGSGTEPVRHSGPTLLEQDVVRLRQQVDSLQREQRQQRAALDWQGRLLTGDGQTDQAGQTGVDLPHPD
ncbi:MAG: hypothetical protein ACHQ7M_11535 [Chloroflexota bacterium]